MLPGNTIYTLRDPVRLFSIYNLLYIDNCLITVIFRLIGSHRDQDILTRLSEIKVLARLTGGN